MEVTELSSGVIITILVLSAAQLVVMIWGLVDLIKRPVEQIRWNNKWIWAAIIVLINSFIGTIVYFVLGRIPAELDDSGAPSAIDADKTQRAVDSLYGGSDR